MQNRIHELLHRNLHEVFGEGEPLLLLHGGTGTNDSGCMCSVSAAAPFHVSSAAFMCLAAFFIARRRSGVRR